MIIIYTGDKGMMYDGDDVFVLFLWVDGRCMYICITVYNLSE